MYDVSFMLNIFGFLEVKNYLTKNILKINTPELNGQNTECRV